MKSLQIILLLLAINFAPGNTYSECMYSVSKDAIIWYLGENGFAVLVDQKFLVFDYVPGKSKTKVKNLSNGFLNPDFLQVFNTKVFISQPGKKHFCKDILTWEKDIYDIEYFFGWNAGNTGERCHTLISPNTKYKKNDLEVYTIGSDKSGTAFLVMLKDLVIYFVGNYRGDYKKDFEYLSTITPKIDLAFLNQKELAPKLFVKQYVAFIKHFNPNAVHIINDYKEKSDFNKFTAYLNSIVQANSIACCKTRGEKYFYKNGILISG